MTELLEKQLDISADGGAEDVSQFLSEIHRYPRLSLEQERELARRCAQGDEDAIRQMVNANLRLVVSIAREYAGRGVALLDLIQEGSIGLLAAARKFDYTLEYRFSTYATKWIRQGVTRCLLNQGSAIRIPGHTADRIRKIRREAARLRQLIGAEPDISQLARAVDMEPEKVEQLLEIPEVCSLDSPAGDGDDGTLAMLLEDIRAPQPQEELVRRELKHAVDTLMASLNERQRFVLRHHFGMEDGVCYSLEEIGKKLGISKERARQIERQAMEKFLKMGAGMGLEEFLA